jgi:isopentenyl diphosphate isomerase/L-lactate dehydrogenase-like FMN-dependent dehydrogenase
MAASALRPAALAFGAASGPYATFEQIRAAAHERLSGDVWDFLEGGAGREATLAANLAAWDEWHLIPRVMSGCSAPQVSTSFLGVSLAMPVLSAPFGGDALFHPEGQLAVARANERAGLASIVPEASSFSLEAIAAASSRAARIMQLHPLGEERHVLALIERARQAGYQALCITVDCPINGWRERNLRNGFQPPLERFTGNYPPDGAVAFAVALGQLLDPTSPPWTWEQLADVCERGGLPWIAKGILSAHDARAAVAAGASAIVVSNHGGRQLDSAPPALRQLPAIVEEVGGEVEIAIDGGVRYGTDVVKALALGADVVLIGRAVAYALAAGGEDGVVALYDLIRAELETQLRLLGRAGVGELDATAAQAA